MTGGSLVAGAGPALRTGLVSAALLLAISLSMCSSPARAAAGFLQISGTGFTYNDQPVVLRGVNFSNEPWVYGGTIADIDVNERDYGQVDAWGANSIRFIVTAQNYAADRDGFYRVMDRHISYARAHRLWMIPNLHVLPDGCYEDYAKTCPIWRDRAMQESVISFWREFAQRYQSEPVIAGYDLLNEPTPPSRDQWFSLAERIKSAVRAVDRNHFSFIESGEDGQFPKTFGPATAYSVHIYDPEKFTNESCGTCAYPGRINGEQWDRARMVRAAADGEHAIQWARDNHVPLWVGEFGSRTNSGYGRYLADMVDVMNNEWHVHWSLWSYRSAPGDFGMYTCAGLACPDSNIISAVVPGLRGSLRLGTGSTTGAASPTAPATAEGQASPVPAPTPALSPVPTTLETPLSPDRPALSGRPSNSPYLGPLVVGAIIAITLALVLYAARRRRTRGGVPKP